MSSENPVLSDHTSGGDVMDIPEHWADGMPRADMIDEIDELRRTCESWRGTVDSLLREKAALADQQRGAVSAERKPYDGLARALCWGNHEAMTKMLALLDSVRELEAEVASLRDDRGAVPTFGSDAGAPSEQRGVDEEEAK